MSKNEFEITPEGLSIFGRPISKITVEELDQPTETPGVAIVVMKDGKVTVQRRPIGSPEWEAAKATMRQLMESLKDNHELVAVLERLLQDQENQEREFARESQPEGQDEQF